MRYLRRTDGKWHKDTPPDPLRWLWDNDGGEAVAVDDATSTYYCARPEMMETYQAAWAKEGKKDDKRTAQMFIDLAPLVHDETK
jgi:hypothetical protein